MARDNKARITNTGWISFDYNPKDRIQRELRVCNGSAPNGDIEYWKRYMSSTMSHVRAGAQ
jgi:hypothetical protein